MDSKAKPLSKDEMLSKILGLFDEKDKRILSRQLVKVLDLDEHKEPYLIQVEKLLGRKLGENERFKLETLDRIVYFHDINILCPAPPPK